MAQLGFRHDAAEADSGEGGGDFFLDAWLQEPEAGHGAIVNNGVIDAHFQAERIDHGTEVEDLITVRHAMVAEDVQLDGAVVFFGRIHELGDPALVMVGLFTDLRGVVSYHVEEPIKSGPVL